MADKLKVNRTYTFNIKNGLSSSTLFKSGYQALKLISMINASEASRYVDVYTLHKNATAIDTSGSIPKSADDCTFLLFKNSSDETTVLAEEYIDSDSIAISSKQHLTFEVVDVEDADQEIITNFIKSLGYNPTVSKVSSTIV
jgi:ribosome-binding ATPase YchF (GTP1/OBG family)